MRRPVTVRNLSDEAELRNYFDKIERRKTDDIEQLPTSGTSTVAELEAKINEILTRLSS